MKQCMKNEVDEEAASLTADDAIVLRHLSRESFELAKRIIRMFPQSRSVARGHLHNAIHWRDLTDDSDRTRRVDPLAAAWAAHEKVDATLAELARVTLPLFGGRNV